MSDSVVAERRHPPWLSRVVTIFYAVLVSEKLPVGSVCRMSWFVPGCRAVESNPKAKSNKKQTTDDGQDKKLPSPSDGGKKKMTKKTMKVHAFVICT